MWETYGYIREILLVANHHAWVKWYEEILIITVSSHVILLCYNEDSAQIIIYSDHICITMTYVVKINVTYIM